MEPTNTKTITVHKEGAEGSLQVDAYTGLIKTPLIQRPDWAEGLTNCLLQERTVFYQKRLGPAYKGQESALAFQDLSWLGLDAEQAECQLDADSDYRSDVVAKALGIDREDFETEQPFGSVVAEAELDLEKRDLARSEASEDNAELLTGFLEKHPLAAEVLKTGTEG